MEKISVITPAYNEEKIIEATYKQLSAELKKLPYDYEMLIGNDGSKDNTLKILKGIAKKDKRVRVVSHYPNKGLGYTLRELWTKAKGEYVLYCNADLPYLPTIIPTLIKEAENADVVVCSKYMGVRAEGLPITRVLPSKIFYIIYRLLFGITVRDQGSGLVLFRKEVLDGLNIKAERFDVHIEYFAKLFRKHARVKEIPAHYIHRAEGRFSVLRDGSKLLANALKLWWRLKTEGD